MRFTRPTLALALTPAAALAAALMASGCDGGSISGTSRMPPSDAGGRAARDAGAQPMGGSDAGRPPSPGVDAGETPSPPPAGDACMGLDFLGECQGTIARWCDMGVLREMECGSAGCGWVDGTTGFYCGGTGVGPGGTGGGADAGPGAPPPPPTGTGDCADPTEQEELRLTNEARTSMGLSAFVCDERLTRAARLHSQDMCDLGYFDHTSADGRSFVDRITAQGATYSTAGENIAWGQTTPAEVHDGWMHSPGHRANILNGAFHRIGIGYVSCAGRPYWTQDFTN